MIEITTCPNCHRDLREHIEAVHETGHPVTKCPSCYFPLEIYEKAVRALGKYGFEIAKPFSWKPAE